MRCPAPAAHSKKTPMKTYLVGGAVRDPLLGLQPGDNDHVVVGSTPEQMLALGFKPVGRDFPVFLHPQTGEEYALARTERKSGRGYRGFVVDSRSLGHAGRRPGPSRLHHQRHRPGRGRRRWSIRWTACAISKHAFCAMRARPSSRIRCASCAPRASWRASLRWVSAWRRKHAP